MKPNKNQKPKKYTTQGGYSNKLKPPQQQTIYIYPHNPNKSQKHYTTQDPYNPHCPYSSLEHNNLEPYRSNCPYGSQEYYNNLEPYGSQAYHDSTEHQEPIYYEYSCPYDNLYKELYYSPSNYKYLHLEQYQPEFHQEYKNNVEQQEEEIIKFRKDKVVTTFDRSIESLDDLVVLSQEVEKYNFTNISLNQEHLENLRDPLINLANLIGMESIKKNIFNQLIFFLQNIEPQFPHMLHTCIEGPPGCGKTELANILAQIYANLGIIEKPKVVVARRSDLVAGYLGQTAQKTQDVIDSAKGGVLLIDEAYSLGNEEKKDSFAKECIDTLNQNLTEGKGDFICIIAGYKEDLEKSFFGFNSGLERRFPYRFSIEGYTGEQLCQIYKSILGKNDWAFNDEEIEKIEKFFVENKDKFKFNGGDLENLVHFSKLAYAKNRIFNSQNDKKINLKDIEVALQMFISNKKYEKQQNIPQFMYN